MALEHTGDWLIDDAGVVGGNIAVRLYHVHKQPEKTWKVLSAVIDGKCRTCEAEAPKSLRIRVAFWGINDGGF